MANRISNHIKANGYGFLAAQTLGISNHYVDHKIKNSNRRLLVNALITLSVASTTFLALRYSFNPKNLTITTEEIVDYINKNPAYITAYNTFINSFGLHPTQNILTLMFSGTANALIEIEKMTTDFTNSLTIKAAIPALQYVVDKFNHLFVSKAAKKSGSFAQRHQSILIFAGYSAAFATALAALFTLGKFDNVNAITGEQLRNATANDPLFIAAIDDMVNVFSFELTQDIKNLILDVVGYLAEPLNSFMNAFNKEAELTTLLTIISGYVINVANLGIERYAKGSVHGNPERTPLINSGDPNPFNRVWVQNILYDPESSVAENKEEETESKLCF